MFTVGYATHPGLIRKDNEDAVNAFASPDQAIAFAVVADGMGAGDSGRAAAHFCVEILKYAFHELILGELILDRAVNVERRLTEAIKAANKKIMETLPNGACSVTTTVVVEDLVHVAHVGHSRAYLLQVSEPSQLTVDHNLNQYLVDGSVRQRLLYRVVGQETPLKIDVFAQAISSEDSLLLCTDGLWELVSDQEMADIVRQYTDPQQACDQLIDKANERGGRDNIAVALIQPVG